MESLFRPTTPSTPPQSRHASCTPRPLFFTRDRLRSTQEFGASGVYSSATDAEVASYTPPAVNGLLDCFSPQLKAVESDPFRSFTPSRQPSAYLSYHLQKAENANGYVSLEQSSLATSVGSYSFASVLDLYDDQRHLSAPLIGKAAISFGRVSSEATDDLYHSVSPTKQSGATQTSITSPGGVSKHPPSCGNFVTTSSLVKTRHIPTDSEDLTSSDPLLTLLTFSSESSNPLYPYNSETSREEVEPQTPIVYHRGSALTEIIKSYRLPRVRIYKGIDEPNTVEEEYYQLTHNKHIQSQGEIVVMASSAPVAKDEAQQNARATPPRALHGDYASAYNCVTSRLLVKSGRSPLMKNLPLPPIPVAVRDRWRKAQGSQSLRLDEDNTVPRPIATSAPSFNRVLSQTSYLGLQLAKSDDEAANSILQLHRTGTQPDLNELVVPYTPHNLNSAHSYSLPSMEGTPTSDLDLNQNYYDDGSIFAFSARRDDSQKGETANSVTFQRDDSMDKIIDAYKYTVANVTMPQEKLCLSSHHSDLSPRHSLSGRQINTTTNDAMDDLINQYNRHHDAVPASIRSIEPHAKQHSIRIDEMFLPPASRHPSTPPKSSLNEVESNDGKNDHCNKSVKRPVHLAAKHTLNSVSRSAPLGPLPATPTLDSENLTPGLLQKEVPTPFCIDYGNTADLLRQSHTSIEVGRGAELGNLSQRSESSESLNLASSPNFSLGDDKGQEDMSRFSNVEEYGDRLIDGSVDEIVTRDIRHLSAMSGMSDLSGSVYVIGDSAAPVEEVATVEPWTPSSKSISSGNSLYRRPKYCKIAKVPVQSTCVPFAAFPQSAVAPGYSRFSSSAREALKSSERQAQASEKLAAVSVSLKEEDADDAEDWETIAESRRTLHGLIGDAGSFADLSSSNSISTYQNVGVHPGDTRFAHMYRLHSPPGQAETLLMPAYDFRDGAGFPNRNALTSPTPIAQRQPYRYPDPLPQTHDNPFTSSPPPIPKSPSVESPQMEFRIESVRQDVEESNSASPFWHRPQLSVVYEVAAEDSSRTLNSIEKYPKAQSTPEAVYLDASVGDSSDWLTSGPGPEITTAEDQDTPRSAFLNSGANAKLVHLLRREDPRMASSPLSATNSFAKLSRLGPRGNITGTPNGTGMREAGSSLVGSSSPFYCHGSSPLIAQGGTPSTLGSVVRHPAQSSPLISEFSSPFIERDQRHNRTRSTIKQSLSKERKTFRDALLSASRSEDHARPAVAGQKQLLQMSLVPEENGHILTNVSRVREPFDRPSYRGGSNGTNRPLLPLTGPSPALASPHLLCRYRAPSSQASGLCERKQKLSWICFTACALLPPLLVLYGYGYLDGLMFALSHRDIEHFGTRQKQVAKWVGFSVTVVAVLGLTTLLIVLRTVPNDYPR